jgi:isopentenyl-diphosphate delta-isomerase
VIWLDADSRLEPDFVAQSVRHLNRRRLQVACPRYRPATTSWGVKAVFFFFNAIFWLLQKILPSGSGMCIIAAREFALEAGGFRPEFTFDDMEFIRRLGRRGRFGILPVSVGVADRRFHTDGLLPTLGRYLLLSALFTFGLFRAANCVRYRFAHHPQPVPEYVVLVDSGDRPQGLSPKAQVHGADTPLHRAFSVFLFNSRGDLLLQQRSRGKPTWPGIWSNTCCGHPAPGESYEAAARRRLREELGISEVHLALTLPDFRYRAELNGMVEHEVCPVFLGYSDQAPRPDRTEVAAITWVTWKEFLERVDEAPESLSPWCREEALELRALEATRRFLDSLQGATHAARDAVGGPGSHDPDTNPDPSIE